MLLNVATRELRGSPATAAPGPTAGDGGALTGGAPTWRPQRLAPGATAPLLEPFHLQEGKVSFIENKFCNMLYGFAKGKNLSVQEDMLCAADFSTGKSICQGDSGGPLVCDFSGSWVLMGLASWGFDCRHPVYPSIFTNVTYFTDWIEEIQRLTPHPEPMSALTPLPEPTSTPPQTQFPHQSLQAAASSVLGTAFGPPQTWPLLLFLLGSPRQTMW
ncbi:hypothetical protein MG293_007675 [Ovis ammon polii]|uniref:Peptidase S1 domain-containing protein n=1 Tax=Ovis ammon polii TaxID=230172 RepID=A0AAD4UBZ5_OVIAM|nr:hypothetical protein MG293_007675 [Ovis ammon polii]KAI4573608.1 hypothetical protein MJT46_004848 [Ovis ammon polii x Ovis aries]